MNRWVVYSTCSIFALCSPAALAPGLRAEEGSGPPAAGALGPAPLRGLSEPTPQPPAA